MTASMFQARQICAGYGRKEILHSLDFSLEPGEITGLIGPNGCGKTTLLKTICQLLPYQGTFTLNNTLLDSLNSRELAKYISYIPQKQSISLSLSVFDVVLMGFNPYLKLLENPTKAQKELARNALREVEMESYSGASFLTLSEGQKQLVILARTLVEHTALLLLDEPDSALDFSNRHKILQLLNKQVTTLEKAALLTLHDPNLALEFCHRILFLKDGQITASIRPKTDSIQTMEQAFSSVFGPVTIIEIEKKGKLHRLVVPR